MSQGAAKIDNHVSRVIFFSITLSGNVMLILLNIIKFLSAVLTFCCHLYNIKTPCFFPFDSLRPSQQFFSFISRWVFLG